jgi:hypothetical protein
MSTLSKKKTARITQRVKKKTSFLYVSKIYILQLSVAGRLVAKLVARLLATGWNPFLKNTKWAT